ncbi:penicillin acylase family protein [Reichenbachiella carrageenanivorans]|uniref:Penicillin acylase family protein n=1 Tax=Reichenbachiella carrageenanivorans TaxID=2979869 RepID=A0ABY6CWF3_9BACT|nr:penicillin acylase family protein [Reichenbachiella carrageenanivorans]UXX78251.1 penicillin acylase family protein [Reichenbachiella carrageenanivorans]
MKLLRFIFALGLTLLFFFYLNHKQDKVPPLGHFLSPFTGFWQNGELDGIDLPAEIDVDQLKAPVQIKFDENQVPHIFAENDYDLYFAQGYVTAFHRLWQMEFQVLAAAGRTAEVVGERQLDFDRIQRRKGLVYGAKRSLEVAEQDPQVINMIQAYTDGINYWVDQLDYEDYPIEYKLLDYAPEPWTNLKVMLMIKNMADMLSRGENDLENTNALSVFGLEDFNKLFPETYKNIDPVIPAGTKWDFKPISVDQPAVSFPQVFTKEVIENPDPRNGSNNFVVSADRTANGKVLLANEPDLSLNLPSIWYVIQLHAPGINVMGASLPGVPSVVVGFNDSIAWGVTNAKRDVVDWYYIKFRNDKREEYQYDNKWLKTEKVIEEFKVREEESFYDTIVYTHYGPVAYDRNFLGDGDRINLAMKWTAHEGSKEFKTFYQLNRAGNYDDFMSALKYYSGPPQNFAFASAQGDIAMTIQGKFPAKWQGQGKFLLDGRDARQEWQAIIPPEQNATAKNPLQGFVSSANQHPVDSTYPYYVYDYNYEFYRNRRINDRLRLLDRMTVKDMIRLQNDNYNYRASESLPIMLDALDTMKLTDTHKKAYFLLKQWDYFAEPEWIAPTIYKVWWDELYALVWDEFDEQELAMSKPHVFNTIYLMTNEADSKFFDIESTKKTETLNDLINASYATAMSKLEDWKNENDSEYIWYLYKNTRVKHLLGLEPFSFEKVKIGGDRNIVNAASGRHGPSWRMIVEMSANGPKAWGIYPGSQSGNPGHPSYGDMIEDWASGNYAPLHYLKSATDQTEHIIFSQTLQSEN